MKFIPALLLSVVLVLSFGNMATAQWQHMNGPYGFTVIDFVVQDAHSFLAVNAPDERMLYHSSDEGNTWQLFTIPGSEGYVKDMFVLDQWLFVIKATTLSRSSDYGEHWENFPSPTGYFNECIPFGDKLVAYQATQLHVSEDMGETWTLQSGIQMPLSDQSFVGLGDSLVLASHNRVYWLANGDPLELYSKNINGFFFNGLWSDGVTLYAAESRGIVQSTNGGQDWEFIAQVHSKVEAVCADEQFIYGTSNSLNRIYRVEKATGAIDSLSVPFGVLPNGKYLNGYATRMEHLYCMNNMLYAPINGRGMATSKDHGETWELLNHGIACTAVIDFAEFDGDLYSAGYSGIAKSTDDGLTWVQVETPGHIFEGLGISASSTALYASNPAGDIFSSTNKGATWELVGEPMAPYTKPQTVLGKQLFAAEGRLYIDINGLLESKDNGQTWTRSPVAGGPVIERDGKLFTALEQGIAWSSDNGATWDSTSIDLCETPYPCSMQIFDVSGDTIIGMNTVNAVVSTDFGQTWSLYPAPQYTYGPSAMVLLNGTLLVAYVGYDNIYRSLDNGKTWSAFRYQLPNNTAAFLHHGNYLYAGVETSGIWRLTVDEVLPVDMPLMPSSLSLAQNYPNPVYGNTTISYSLPTAEYVTLTVTNTLGQEVARIVDGRVEAGSHSVLFSTSNLVPGVYFYTLRSGNAVATKIMAVER